MAVDPSIEAPISRRLTAIAFADVAGFSTLMQQDEVETLFRWRALRREVIEPAITANHGRLRRVVGDGLFVEFHSAVDAVTWAVTVQAEIVRAENLLGSQMLRLRIGINVEDALVVDDDLHGNGVNIASRIHQLAEPGETIMTSVVHDYVWNKVNARLVDMGERMLKGLAYPVRIYRVEAGMKRNTPRQQPKANIQAIHRPSVAVLPFRNIGGNRDEDYFGEGITEEIISVLSRSRSLFVIARNSTLRYRDTNTGYHEIAEELGVRYVIEGSVRRQDKRLRIAPKLLDATLDLTLWAERYEGGNDDLFEFQDRITTNIAARIEPRLYEAESARVRSKPTESLGAYDCVLRALPLLHRFDNHEHAEAAKYLDRAIELDSSYAQAYAHRAWLSVLRVAEARTEEVPAEAARARAHIERAMAIDSHDPFVLAVSGHVHALLHKEPATAAGLFERSLDINPNSSFAWGMSGLTYCYLGQPDEALDRFGRAWRLSPFDPLIFFYTAGAGMAEFLAERYENAVPWYHKALQVNPRFLACLRHLVTTLAHLGRYNEARAVSQQMLNLEPGFRVSIFASWYPLQPRANLDRYVWGLRAGGLPE
jgi:TolB-like protein/class 3 adenylate cyclase/Tfp pilus assembly protein PilF